jgi:hypothetical protein
MRGFEGFEFFAWLTETGSVLRKGGGLAIPGLVGFLLLTPVRALLSWLRKKAP